MEIMRRAFHDSLGGFESIQQGFLKIFKEKNYRFAFRQRNKGRRKISWCCSFINVFFTYARRFQKLPCVIGKELYLQVFEALDSIIQINVTNTSVRLNCTEGRETKTHSHHIYI